MSAEDSFDDEIVQIFAEEVEEVLSQIDSNLPDWEHNSNNEPALKEVRRAFHTLKGSGRMVQALDIGELAWAVESMLNRVIDGSLKPQPAIIEVVRETRAAIPALMKAFQNRQAAALSGVNFMQLIEQANNIVAGKPVKPLRPNAKPQLSDEFLAVTAPVAQPMVSVDLMEIQGLKERISQMNVSIDDLKRNFINFTTLVDSINAQVKMMPRSLDPAAINKQLRDADQEIQELKYFIKASSEKLMADALEQQRRLDAKVDKELRVVSGINDRVNEEMKLAGEQLHKDFASMVKVWSIGAAGVSLVLSVLIFAILS